MNSSFLVGYRLLVDLLSRTFQNRSPQARKSPQKIRNKIHSKTIARTKHVFQKTVTTPLPFLPVEKTPALLSISPTRSIRRRYTAPQISEVAFSLIKPKTPQGGIQTPPRTATRPLPIKRQTNPTIAALWRHIFHFYKHQLLPMLHCDFQSRLVYPPHPRRSTMVVRSTQTPCQSFKAKIPMRQSLSQICR